MRPKCFHNIHLLGLLLGFPLLWYACQGAEGQPEGETPSSFTSVQHSPPIPVKAQKRLPFDIFTVEDGLCSNAANTLLLDSRGYLWIATDDGLNRYDGHQFRQYQNSPEDQNSLSDNTVLDIIEDSRGDIWVLTLQKGLCRLQVAQDKFTAYCDTSVMTRLGYPRQEMGIDKYDRIWLNYPLAYFDTKTEQFIKISDKNAQGFGEGHNGDFFAVLVEGKGISSLAKLDYAIDTFQVLIIDSLGTISSTNDIKAGPDGGLWIGTQNGSLSKYLPGSNTFIDYGRSVTRSTIKNLFPSPDGQQLWAATWGGLVRFAPGSHEQDSIIRYRPNETDPRSLPVGQALDVLIDRQSNLWVATLGGGLCKYAPSRNQFEHFTHHPGDSTSLADKNVECIFEDSKGRVWIGTKGGLNLMGRDKGTFQVFRNRSWTKCSPDMVSAISEDTATGLLYIGFWGDGIRAFNPETGQFTVPQATNINMEAFFEKKPCPGFIRNFTWTKDGALCAASWGDALQLYKPSEQTLQFFIPDTIPPTLRSNLLSFAYTDQDGLLWIGNTEGKGLQSLDWKKGEAHSIYEPVAKRRTPFSGTFTDYLPAFSDSTQLASGTINYIFEDSKKRFWLGTPKGLHLLNRATGQARRYGLQHGFPNETINSIIEDDNGRLWVTTNKGLCQFDPGQERVVKDFEAKGGQFSMACFKNKRGELFFGGSDGFNIFHPDSLKFNRQPPQMSFTQLTVNGISQTITLSGQDFTYDMKNFTFEFSALDFSEPDNNLYRYNLEGYDPKWTEPSSKNFAVYTNLPPGKYIMRVKGCNSDNIWNEAGIQMPFRIQKPWWSSWWFRMFAISILAGGGWFFWQRRIKKIRHKQEDQEKLIKYLQVQTLQAQMNPHFLFNVLASLQNLILISDTQKADYYLVNLSRLIRSYLYSSLKSDYSKGYSSENEISLAEELELIQMFIEFEKLQYQDKFEYHIEYGDAGIVPENLTLPPMLLQPYVENAIKHGIMYKEGKGNLWIQVNYNQEFEGFTITIKDDGVGMQRAKALQNKSVRRHKSKGRELAQKRIEVLQELGYPIVVHTDSSESGTTVTIKIG